MTGDEATTSNIAASRRSPARPRVAALVGLSVGTPPLVPLRARETVVGRTKIVGLRLDIRGVSRKHAKIISVAPAATSILDLGSRNGTFINERRIEAADLAEGDEIRFGPTATMRFTCHLVDGFTTPESVRIASDIENLLTPRELEVAGLVASGLRNAEVAARLRIGPRTVSTHLEHIYAKLELSSRHDLTCLIHGRI